MLAVITTFLMAFAVEGLNSLRYSMQSQTYEKISKTLNSGSPDDVYKVSCVHRFLIMVIYFLSLLLAYLLMLIVMTFNAGLFVACVMGLTAGYFVFGFVRKRGFTKIYAPETDKCCTSID